VKPVARNTPGVKAEFRAPEIIHANAMRAQNFQRYWLQLNRYIHATVIY
jgi:hypothetical protein